MGIISDETEKGKKTGELTDKQKFREVTEFFGKTGSGKSYLAKQYIEKFSRQIIYDPTNEYTKAISFSSMDDLIRYVYAHKVFKVKFTDSDSLDDLSFIAMAVGKCGLIVEEAQLAVPSMHRIPPNFQNAIFRGRHRAVSIIMIAQRPSSVNIIARSQWNKIFSFYQTEQSDTKWLRDTSGFDLPDLESLEQGAYYEIQPRKISFHPRKD